MQEYKDKQAMERLRANQQQQNLSFTDIANNANAISESANTIGQGINKAGTALNNTGMQSFGSNISKFSGQPALKSLKTKAVGGIGNGISGIGSKMAGAQNGLISKAGTGLSKLGTGLAANAGAQGTAAGLGSAATTAGTAAGAGSALGGAAGGATAAGAGTAAAGAGAAGAGASGAMAAAGPIGWAALAAYTIYNMVSSAQKKNEMKAMQASINEAQRSQELSENELASQRAGLEENRQQNLANMQAQTQQNQNNEQLTQELLSNYQALENPQQNPEDGAITGAAAPAESQIPPALPFEGSASQELDNNAAQKQSIMDMFKSLGGKVGNGIKDFSNGYQDNLQNGFSKGDLFNGVLNNEVTPSVTDEGTVTGGANELKKSLLNRVGEAFGTGTRVMSNPWTQAGIAALATKATGGDWADSLNNAYKYGTTKATSNFYNNKLNPGKAPNALQNYTKDDYAADALAKYRDTMSDNNAKRVDYQAYAKKSKEFSDKLKFGMISPEQYTNAMRLLNDNFGDENYAVGVDSAQISNDTRKVNETGRHNLVTEGIQQQNADTGARRVDESITHNRNTESLGKKNYDLSVEKWNAKQASDRQKQIDKQVQNGELIRCTINGQSGYLTPSQFNEARKKYGKGVSRL